MPGVTNPKLAGYNRFEARPELAYHDFSELTDGYCTSTSRIEHLKVRSLVLHQKHVSASDILDVDVVTQLPPILIANRWQAIKQAQGKPASNARVSVVKRITSSLDIRIADTRSRNIVTEAKIPGQQLDRIF